MKYEQRLVFYYTCYQIEFHIQAIVSNFRYGSNFSIKAFVGRDMVVRYSVAVLGKYSEIFPKKIISFLFKLPFICEVSVGQYIALDWFYWPISSLGEGVKAQIDR